MRTFPDVVLKGALAWCRWGLFSGQDGVWVGSRGFAVVLRVRRPTSLEENEMRATLTGLAIILSLVIGFFILDHFQAQVDAYTCIAVSSEHSDVIVETVPITIQPPSILATPYSRAEWDNRASVRAEFDNIGVSVGDLCQQTYINSLYVNIVVENRGTSEYTIPVRAIELLLGESPSEDQDGASESTGAFFPRARNASVAKWSLQEGDSTNVGDSSAGNDVSYLGTEFLVEEVLVRPQEKVSIRIVMGAAPFQSGILRVPLRDLAEDREIVLRFELEYLLTYRRARY